MSREATPGDLPRLLALQAELASPWPDLLELAVGGDPAGGPVALVACAEEADEPVGYLLAVPGAPGDGSTEQETADDFRSVYLAEVVVAPGHRREGHGTALIEAAAARFAGYDRLRLTARADDEAALAFYRANGFQVVETLPDHYGGENGDGLVFARELAAD